MDKRKSGKPNTRVRVKYTNNSLGRTQRLCSPSMVVSFDADGKARLAQRTAFIDPAIGRAARGCAIVPSVPREPKLGFE